MEEEERKLYDALPPQSETNTGPPTTKTAEAAQAHADNSKAKIVPPRKINVSGGVLQQQAIKKVQPPYPAEARSTRIEGEVKVQILVSEEGRVIETTVIEGPEQLREVAREAASQWIFEPATLSGQAVRMAGVLSFKFTLK